MSWKFAGALKGLPSLIAWSCPGTAAEPAFTASASWVTTLLVAGVLAEP